LQAQREKPKTKLGLVQGRYNDTELDVAGVVGVARAGQGRTRECIGSVWLLSASSGKT
jgi:hypothetical protein